MPATNARVFLVVALLAAAAGMGGANAQDVVNRDWVLDPGRSVLAIGAYRDLPMAFVESQHEVLVADAPCEEAVRYGQPIRRSHPKSPGVILEQHANPAARQTFRPAELLKARTVIAKQTAFRTNPEEALVILKQAIYVQIAEPVQVVLERIALCIGEKGPT